MSNCLNNLIPAITETEGVADAYKLPVTGPDGLLNHSFFNPSTLPAPGSDTEVLFNDGGAIGAEPELNYNKASKLLATTNLVVPEGTKDDPLADGNIRLGWANMVSSYDGPSTTFYWQLFHDETLSFELLYDETADVHSAFLGGDEVWHAGNQLDIGTTASSARTALELTNGTYTPTLTSVANVAATSSPTGTYSRVGDIVTCGVSMQIDPTAASVPTIVGISLPIASNFSSTTQAFGTGTCLQAWGIIRSDATNDRVELLFNTADIANRTWYGTFQYRVI